MPAKDPFIYNCLCGISYRKSNRSHHYKIYHTNQLPKYIKQERQLCPCCGRLITRSNLARHVIKCKNNLYKLKLKQIRSKSSDKTAKTLDQLQLQVYNEEAVFGKGKKQLLSRRARKNINPTYNQDEQSGSNTIQCGITKNRNSLFEAIAEHQNQKKHFKQFDQLVSWQFKKKKKIKNWKQIKDYQIS